MRILLAISLLFPVLASGQGFLRYNTNTMFSTPTNFFDSNILSSAAIAKTKGANGELSLSISNASITGAMLHNGEYKKLNAGETNLQAYANHATNPPVTVNTFAATTTNALQILHSGGAIIGRADTNGIWLNKRDVIFTNVTTDATITTIGSMTVPDGEVWQLNVVANAYSPGATNAGAYHRMWTVTATNGVARGIGSIFTTGQAWEDVAGWDFTIDASGATIRFRGTGSINQTNKWTVRTLITPNVW